MPPERGRPGGCWGGRRHVRWCLPLGGRERARWGRASRNAVTVAHQASGVSSWGLWAAPGEPRGWHRGWRRPCACDPSTNPAMSCSPAITRPAGRATAAPARGRRGCRARPSSPGPSPARWRAPSDRVLAVAGPLGVEALHGLGRARRRLAHEAGHRLHAEHPRGDLERQHGRRRRRPTGLGHGVHQHQPVEPSRWWRAIAWLIMPPIEWPSSTSDPSRGRRRGPSRRPRRARGCSPAAREGWSLAP